MRSAWGGSVAAVASLVLLAVVPGPFTSRATFAQPLRLTVTRMDASGTVSTSVARAGAALSVYRALRGLGDAPHGPLHCPMEGFVRYRLQFSQRGRSVLTASADPSGCQFVAIAGRGVRWAAAAQVPGERFWMALAAALRMRPGNLLAAGGAPGVGACPDGSVRKPSPTRKARASPFSPVPCERGTCAVLVALTSDGGLHWSPGRMLGGPVTGVGAVPRAFAWVGAPGRIYEFLLGGAQRTVAAAGLDPLAVNDGVVWASRGAPAASGVEIFRISLRGGSRVHLPDPCPHEELAGLSFPTPAEGWALCGGEPGAGMQEKSVYLTVDGGSSWRLRSTTRVGEKGDGLGLNGYAGGIQFLAGGQGWIYGGRGFARRTIDFGHTWRGTGLPFAPSVSSVPSLSFSTRACGHALVGSLLRSGAVELLATFDGGRHWLPANWW